VKTEAINFHVTKSSGEVSGLFYRPPGARALFVFGHGAGAGMRHPFMELMTEKMGALSIATLRYQFPYMEKKLKRPDPRAILLASVRAAVTKAMELAHDLPVFAGGKSMGGRMSSLADAESPLPIRGLIFLGFPLHPTGNPSTERGDHLQNITHPMLFLQGTRDSLADLSLLRPISDNLGNKAKLHIIEGGDHSFRIPKSMGRTEDQILEELAATAVHWMYQFL